MRRMISVTILVWVLCLLCIETASTETLYVNGLEKRTTWQDGPDSVHNELKRWYTQWTEQNPGMKLNAAYQVGFQSTSSLIKGLQKKNAKQDVLMLSTSSFDFQQIVQANALADLSGSEMLSAMVQSMHPVLQSVACQNGQLYGIPCGLTFSSFLSYDQEAALLSGYHEEDMPRSFSALLDFLEQWIMRCKTDPVANVCVTNTFVEDSFCEESYTVFLTQLFIEQYVQQCAAQHKECRFNTPEMIAMLDRIASIGAELYHVDQPVNSNYCLLSSTSLPQDIPQLIPGRMTEDDPILIPVQASMLCVSASSRHQEEATAFIEMYMDLIQHRTYDFNHMTAEDAEMAINDALLFVDASGNVISDRGSWYEQYVLDTVAKYEAIASDPFQSKSKRENAQARLERYAKNNWVENAAKAKYQMTAEELAAYQSYADFLCVVTPDLTVVSSKTTRKLIKRFASGAITAEVLASGLDAQRK